MIKFDENQRIMMHVNVSKYTNVPVNASLCSWLKLMKSVQRCHKIYVTTQIYDDDNYIHLINNNHNNSKMLR